MAVLDFKIDPTTGDLVESEDGWFEEVDSSETAVYMALFHRYNEWWGDPDAGSRLHLAHDQGDGIAGRAFLEQETQRAVAPLVAEGYIADVTSKATRTQVGRIVVELSYRDLKSGQAVELELSPFGG